MILVLPIYYTQEFKTKKDKTFLVGMNWYRNAHYLAETRVKKHYYRLISEQIEAYKSGIIEKGTRYRVEYKIHYKNKVSDGMNILSIIDKYLNDALQSEGVIKNDNVQYYTSGSWEVAGQDKENPRIEIEVML